MLDFINKFDIIENIKGRIAQLGNGLGNRGSGVQASLRPPNFLKSLHQKNSLQNTLTIMLLMN